MLESIGMALEEKHPSIIKWRAIGIGNLRLRVWYETDAYWDIKAERHWGNGH